MPREELSCEFSGLGGIVDQDSGWRSRAAVEAVFDALHVIQNSSSLLLAYAPLRYENEEDGSSTFLDDIRHEVSLSSRFIKDLQPIISSGSSSEALGKRYLDILNWTLSELEIVVGRNVRINLPRKIARVSNYGSGESLDIRINRMNDHISAAQEALETALLEDSAYLFADVHRIGLIVEKFGATTANSILRRVTAPLAILSDGSHSFTDSHALAVPIGKGSISIFEKILKQCFIAIERSRDALEHNPRMAEIKAGLMISIASGSVLTIDGRSEPLSLSDALLSAYDIQHFMNRHQIFISEKIHSLLPEKYRPLCNPEPVELREKPLVLYSVRLPNDTSSPEPRKRKHP